jgi:hypothetical protein
VKSISGKTVRGVFWDLSQGGASVEATREPLARERLICVMSGRVSSRVDGTATDMSKDWLMVVRPAARNVVLTSTDTRNSVVFVFEPLLPASS